MDRKSVVQIYVDEIFSGMEDDKRIISYHHTGGVALLCALLAKKRGLGSELATYAVCCTMFIPQMAASAFFMRSTARKWFEWRSSMS